MNDYVKNIYKIYQFRISGMCIDVDKKTFGYILYRRGYYTRTSHLQKFKNLYLYVKKKNVNTYIPT